MSELSDQQRDRLDSLHLGGELLQSIEMKARGRPALVRNACLFSCIQVGLRPLQPLCIGKSDFATSYSTTFGNIEKQEHSPVDRSAEPR